MLLDKYSTSRLPQLLVDREDFTPYPVAQQRPAWEKLPDQVQSAHVIAGDDAIEKKWPALPASLFLEYVRTGNRTHYETVLLKRRHILADLVTAYCIEPADRYLDPILNAVWSICEESYWGLPAHLEFRKSGPGLPDTTEPVVDLISAETGALLAWTNYLLGSALDEVSPLVQVRIRREVSRRILQPCLEREDFWWMGLTNGEGLNNWNPWINSNWLTCALLLEDDPDRRIKSVARSMRSLDAYIDNYPSDGGCDEGPGYWQHAPGSLFDCLELLRAASDGEINVYDEPLIGEMARYIYRVQIDNRWFVNFADASAICDPSGALIHNFGQRVDDPDMMSFGTYMAETSGFGRGKIGGPMGRRLSAIFSIESVEETEASQPRPRDVWLPETQLLVSRDQEGSSDGLFMAVKGGHNAESHNHNDVGQFIVFSDGCPVLVDAGVETYCRKTFSDSRYDIWTMQSRYHNVPTIDGHSQVEGREQMARDVDCEIGEWDVSLRLDLAPAYPDESGIDSLYRTVTLNRGENVELTDEWNLDHEPNELSLSLLTPCVVEDVDKGTVRLGVRKMKGERNSGRATLICDDDDLTVEVQPIPIEDQNLRMVWGETIHRLLFRPSSLSEKGRYSIRVQP